MPEVDCGGSVLRISVDHQNPRVWTYLTSKHGRKHAAFLVLRMPVWKYWKGTMEKLKVPF